MLEHVFKKYMRCNLKFYALVGVSLLKDRAMFCANDKRAQPVLEV